MNSKAKKLTIIAIAVCAVTAIVAAASAALISSRTDPRDSDRYGAYIDGKKTDSENKVFTFDGKTVTAKYLRSENLKDTAVEHRSDSYGSYDVYADEDETEYLFLLNTDMLCGFLKKNVGEAAAREDAVTEKEALETAERYLSSERQSGGDYRLTDHWYDASAGYYDIQYTLHLNGFKTDDIFRIWVSAKGEITSFSEFNYLRYDGLHVTEDAIKQAEASVENELTKLCDGIEYEAVDSYISIDDEGNLILTKTVDIHTQAAGGYVVDRKDLVANIATK